MKRIDVAIAVITQNGEILICQRKSNDTFGGYWEFPGGKCERGEDFETCLHRELREEIDVAVRIIGQLTPIEHRYPHVHLTLHPFLCEHTHGEPKLIECQKAVWIRPDELTEYRFPPANESLLREVQLRMSTQTPRAATS